MSDEARQASWVRDHLANERTLLAWVRTAIAFMAFGLGIAKLGVLFAIDAAEHPELAAQLPSSAVSSAIGASLIAAGGAIAVAGAVQVQRWSHEVAGTPPRLTALYLTACLAIGTSLALTIYVLS